MSGGDLPSGDPTALYERADAARLEKMAQRITDACTRWGWSHCTTEVELIAQIDSLIGRAETLEQAFHEGSPAPVGEVDAELRDEMVEHLKPKVAALLEAQQAVVEAAMESRKVYLACTEAMLNPNCEDFAAPQNSMHEAQQKSDEACDALAKAREAGGE